MQGRLLTNRIYTGESCDYYITLFRYGTAQSIRRMIAGVLLLGVVGSVQAQDTSSCGSLENHYGPIDYRKANKQQLNLVENAHFTAGVESLTRTSSGYFADDISYTLRVFPNHPRALIMIQRLADREKTDKPANAQWSIPCYFERAIRFQRDDVIVRMLFASYLIKKNRFDEATQQLDLTIKLAGNEPFTHYNIGLVFLDMKNYERALERAHRAAELGFTRTALKNRLVAAGKWVEPPPVPVEVQKP